MRQVENMALALQKGRQAKTRVCLKGKIEKCPSIHGLQFDDVYPDSYFILFLGNFVRPE